MHASRSRREAPVNPVLGELTRGGHLESQHRGAVAVLDADGAVVASRGDIDRPIFPRSAVKALQALPLVESGAADALGLTDDELALACASHGGEPLHVSTAASMLAKAGTDATILECGVHWPSHLQSAQALAARGERPGPLHNNCSGKHAGFVCVACRMAGARDLRDFTRGYVDAAHPVMREITAALATATGCDLDAAPRAIDGCSIPTYGIPLRALALGFARFGSGVGLPESHARAARRLRDAMAAAPFMVGGSGRFDTRVIEHFGERVFCKVGAEAVYCAALPERGLGVAIKIDDGQTRAAEAAMAAVVESALALDAGDAAFLRGLSDIMLRNWNGFEVGRLAATDALRTALQRGH
jgi:L-asparaginase II